MKDSLSIRNGSIKDEDWLFQLFRITMQDYIDKAWGWDELLQREGFISSLPAPNFKILEVNGQKSGSFHLTEKDDHVIIDMILVPPENQRQGYGSHLMSQIKEIARQLDKPIKLSVLKSNPAISFHLHCGFSRFESDDHSIKMSYTS
jgi:N-acetylglutamate synthase-like GNAT family acetyltransferase